MILLRSLVFNVLFYLNVAGLMILGLPCLFKDRHSVHNLARVWARSSLWLLDKICGTKVEFRGLEHIPPGACIIAAKHQSTLETFALTIKLSDFSYILKRELVLIPFFGWYLKRAEQIGIDRSKRSQALADAIRKARPVLAEGRQIFIFPEGTRRPAGAPPRFKSGVAHLYAEMSVVCVPVALNTGLFWPRRSFTRRPGTVVIEFLEPIEPGLDKQSFMYILENRIETATVRLIDEALESDPSLQNILPQRSGAAVV